MGELEVTGARIAQKTFAAANIKQTGNTVCAARKLLRSASAPSAKGASKIAKPEPNDARALARPDGPDTLPSASEIVNG